MPYYKAIISIKNPAYGIKVVGNNGEEYVLRVIEAKNESAALKFVAEGHISLTRPSTSELLDMVKDGAQVEQVK